MRKVTRPNVGLRRRSEIGPAISTGPINGPDQSAIFTTF